MARPVGSKNRPKEAPVLRNDGYLQAVLPSRVTNGNNFSSVAAATILIGQQELNDFYVGNGFARRIVDIPAEEMTRAGFDIENLPDDMLKKVQARCEELDVMRHMNDALRWSRLYGGALIIMGINDAGKLDMPLNLDGAKDLEFLRTVDRFQAVVKTYVTDPSVKEYGEPELWTINPVLGGATSYDVHNSRVLRFDGDSIPDHYRNMAQGWGASVLQSCQTELNRLNSAHWASKEILERSSQAVHSVEGLSNLLMSKNGAAQMQARAELVDMVRSFLNTIIIDGKETYEMKNNAMTGIGDLLDRYAEALSAVTGIPVFLLMGRSPGGLNATGKSNESAWFARVGSMQNDILRRPLDFIISTIIQTLSGNDGGDYQLVFNPLASLSEQEAADLDKAKEDGEKAEMEKFTGYITAGVMDTKEVREQLAERYGLDLSIDIIAPAVQMMEMQTEADLMNKEAGNTPPEDDAE